MSSHPFDTRKVAFENRWLLIGDLLEYKMPFWRMPEWLAPIGCSKEWLLITGSTVVYNKPFVCKYKCVSVLVQVYLRECASSCASTSGANICGKLVFVQVLAQVLKCVYAKVIARAHSSSSSA